MRSREQCWIMLRESSNEKSNRGCRPAEFQIASSRRRLPSPRGNNIILCLAARKKAQQLICNIQVEGGEADNHTGSLQEHHTRFLPSSAVGRDSYTMDWLLRSLANQWRGWQASTSCPAPPSMDWLPSSEPYRRCIPLLLQSHFWHESSSAPFAFTGDHLMVAGVGPREHFSTPAVKTA